MLHDLTRWRAALAGAVLLAFTALATPALASIEQSLTALQAKEFALRLQAVQALGTSRDARAIPVLEALLAGILYTRKADGRVVIAVPEGRRYNLTHAVTGEALGTEKKRGLKKVRVNNRMRGAVRSAIALLQLSAPQAPLRQAAAEELTRKPAPGASDALRQAYARETQEAVAGAMELAIASIDIATGTPEVRRNAVALLGSSLQPRARSLLQQVAEDGNASETLRAEARTALTSIERKLWMYQQAESLFFGLSLGSVLLLAAVGLAITFGVMGVINMAHGEMVMLGAYTTYVVQQVLPDALELSLLIAVPAAFVVAGSAGIAIERSVIRHLYGRPLETLLATFGVSLILQQTVRTVFSPLNRTVASPDWMSGLITINPALEITTNRVVIIFFALFVLAALAVLLSRTRFGLEVRAVTQNREMARAMGVRTGRVDMLTFGLGSGIAGMAGVALSQLTNVGPNMGQAYIIDSFMVVVFGGVGNLLGTFAGAMTLGVANKLLEPVSGAVLAKIAVLVFIILFIQRRPRGLFAASGRADT